MFGDWVRAQKEAIDERLQHGLELLGAVVIPLAFFGLGFASPEQYKPLVFSFSAVLFVLYFALASHAVTLRVRAARPNVSIRVLQIFVVAPLGDAEPRAIVNVDVRNTAKPSTVADFTLLVRRSGALGAPIQGKLLRPKESWEFWSTKACGPIPESYFADDLEIEPVEETRPRKGWIVFDIAGLSVYNDMGDEPPEGSGVGTQWRLSCTDARGRLVATEVSYVDLDWGKPISVEGMPHPRAALFLLRATGDPSLDPASD